MLDSTRLVLDFVLTVRHDGHGGVADDLGSPGELTAWAQTHAGVPGFRAGPAELDRVIAVREAVRALFARAVRPGEPSPADAHRLLPVDEAIERLNRAAALCPVAPELTWDADGAPDVRERGPHDAAPVDRVIASLARAAITFLGGDDRQRLRACHGPRCVRYFLKEHPRQEWCKPSCGNRARVARHHERHNSRAARAAHSE
jgi:predicted RNA-binding Zn ribbon-like protein